MGAPSLSLRLLEEQGGDFDSASSREHPAPYLGYPLLDLSTVAPRLRLSYDVPVNTICELLRLKRSFGGRIRQQIPQGTREKKSLAR